MRRQKLLRRVRLSPVLGLLAGGAVSIAAVLLGGAAVAQRPSVVPGPVFEATHLPPLLVMPGEQVKLAYDVACAAAGAEPERGCSVAGTVLVRSDEGDPFRALALHELESGGVRQLVAAVPDAIASGRDGFEYYAELEQVGGDGRLVIPPAGPTAPHRSRLLGDATEVGLGAHVFGSTRSGVRVASARWGDGPADVGLEAGKGLGRIGATSFDVDARGTVYVLDEAHRRVLRWARSTSTPGRVPLSIDGRLADMTIGDDASIYVLESATSARRTQLVRRFDESGREVDVVATAEPASAQIRMGPGGPVVLEHPSHQWMPVGAGGSPVGPVDQRRRGSSGRPLLGGGEVVVLRTGSDVRAALVSAARVQRSWRISSETALAEVQLAAPVGRGLVVVVRVYTDASDEFLVLVLDRSGVTQQFSVAPNDWAEAAPLSRFRLVGHSLYHLGSNAAGAFVDRYGLEVR